MPDPYTLVPAHTRRVHRSLTVASANEADAAAILPAATTKPWPDRTREESAKTIADRSVTLSYEEDANGLVYTETVPGFRVGTDVGLFDVSTTFTSKIPVDAQTARWASAWATCLAWGDCGQPTSIPAGLTLED